MLRRLGNAAWQRAGAAARTQQYASNAGSTTTSSAAGAASSAPTSSSPTAAAAAAAAAPKGNPKIKTPEQLTPEELERALPSMLFTTSNLVWSTMVASAVAAAGLVSMVWLGTWIVNAADSMRVPAAAPQPPQPPPPQKTLAELISERKAELESELEELQQLPRTTEVKQQISKVQKELRSFRPPGSWWWPY